MISHAEIIHYIIDYILPGLLVLNLLIITVRMFLKVKFAKRVTLTNKKTGKSVTVPIEYERTSSKRLMEVMHE